MFKLERGDVVTTINGKVLKVTKTSDGYVYGDNITDDVHFMYSCKELDAVIKEVFYA